MTSQLTYIQVAANEVLHFTSYPARHDDPAAAAAAPTICKDHDDHGALLGAPHGKPQGRKEAQAALPP